MRRTIWKLAAPPAALGWPRALPAALGWPRVLIAIIALAGLSGCSKNAKDDGESSSGSATESGSATKSAPSTSSTTVASKKLLALKFHHDS